MRRALVIGSSTAPPQTESAAERDAHRMEAVLVERGFEVRRLTGADATRAGILAAYDDLIARSGAGDAAVVHFSGHGGTAIQLEPGAAAPTPRLFQYIAPTDFRQTTVDDFRGISSWELSFLLARLTAKTANATVILDCCHAAQMSKRVAGDGDRPRSVEQEIVSRHLADVEAKYGPVSGLNPRGNPLAIRVVACDEWATAFELEDDEGRPAGALTYHLAAVLRELRDVPVSWSAVGVALRQRFAARGAVQRPMIEGPTTRLVFEETERARGPLAISSSRSVISLEGGQLTGVSVGDVYGVMPGGSGEYAAEREIARVEVVRVRALQAEAEVKEWRSRHTELPPGAVAWPLALALPREPVAIAASTAERAALAAAVQASPRLRAAAPGEQVIGTLVSRDGAIGVLDADGVRVLPARKPWSVADAIAQLERFAAAERLLALEGEHGIGEREIEVTWGTCAGDARTPRLPHGEAVSAGEAFYVEVVNGGDAPRYAHVFNVGLRGTITRVSNVAPGGVQIGAGQRAYIGAVSGAVPCFGLEWPASMPEDTPGEDSLFVIVTKVPMDLSGLETGQAEKRSAARAAPTTALQRLLLQAYDGAPRATARGGAAMDEFLVVRRSWMLHPFQARVAGGGFAHDEDRRGMRAVAVPAAWRGGGGAAAGRVELAVRIGVAGDGAEAGAGAGAGASTGAVRRLDVLVCTRSARRRQVYETRTVRISDSARELRWRVAAKDVLEVYVWASREEAAARAPELDDLLAHRAERADLAPAVDALVIRDPAAPWPLAGGACAALANAASDELARAVPGTRALVHASLGGERIATGLRRYEVEGLAIELDVAAEPGA